MAESIKLIVERARKNIKLYCDENHKHTVQKGCFRGDYQDITICWLYEDVQRLTAYLKENEAEITSLLESYNEFIEKKIENQEGGK